MLQNPSAQMFEIWYIAWPREPLPSLFKWWSHSPNWPSFWGSQVGTIEILRKILKNRLLQNNLTHMLEAWYVALPSGLPLSMFKWWPMGRNWPCPRGSSVGTIEIHKKYSKIFFFRSAGLKCLKLGKQHCLVVLYQKRFVMKCFLWLYMYPILTIPLI